MGAGEVEPPQPLEGAAEAEGLGPAGCAAAAALDALFADLHAHATEGTPLSKCSCSVQSQALAEELGRLRSL